MPPTNTWSYVFVCLCVSSQVFKAVQKQKAEQRLEIKQSSGSTDTESAKTNAAEI